MLIITRVNSILALTTTFTNCQFLCMDYASYLLCVYVSAIKALVLVHVCGVVVVVVCVMYCACLMKGSEQLVLVVYICMYVCMYVCMSITVNLGHLNWR